MILNSVCVLFFRAGLYLLLFILSFLAVVSFSVLERLGRGGGGLKKNLEAFLSGIGFPWDNTCMALGGQVDGMALKEAVDRRPHNCSSATCVVHMLSVHPTLSVCPSI